MSNNTYSDSFEDFFTTLREQVSSTPSNDIPEPEGWTWVCDAQARFVSCSPEVTDLLQIPVGDFIGQVLPHFALPPHSARSLELALQSEDFPVERIVNYRSPDGRFVPVSIYIYPTYADTGERSGWHGFAHTLLPEDPASTPIEQVETKPDLIKIAGEIILDILGDIRRSHPAITSSKISNITVNQLGDYPPAAGSSPVRAEAPTNLQEASQDDVYEIEHRLTWGDKLDLNTDEELFCKGNRYRSAGIAGLLKLIFAPKRIIQSDLKWFAVVISMDRLGKSVWVNYPQLDPDEQRVDLDEFVYNPKLILPPIEGAITAPWLSRVVYQAGKDYLRRPDS